MSETFRPIGPREGLERAAAASCEEALPASDEPRRRDNPRDMLQSLRDLFDHLRAPPEAGPQAEEHALQLATAVMLVEVMRADASFAPSERKLVREALAVKFRLAEDESERLAELAEATAQSATDLYTFTSRIDERFDIPRKVRMIECMWQVAYAHGVLSAHERHVLWRIADLLHVPQGAYVHARMRAEQQAGGPTRGEP